MAVDPWYALFPTVAAVTFVGLTAGLWRKRASLGGMELDWMVAFVFCAVAFGGLLAAGAQSWSDPSDVGLAFSGAGAAVALLAAFGAVLQRYQRGAIGTPTFRWVLFAAALGLACLGGGALLANTGGPAKAAPAVWTIVPLAVGASALIPVAYLVSRAAQKQAGIANTIQLFAGAVLVVAGLVGGALGDLLIGSGLGMTGGGVLYSGVSAVAGRAPLAGVASFKARAAPSEREPLRGGEGRKVRVPKGAAMRVSAFRDDDLPPGESK